MTAAFDLTIRNGTLSTASETFCADIGVSDGRISALAERLPPGKILQDGDGPFPTRRLGTVGEEFHLQQGVFNGHLALGVHSAIL